MDRSREYRANECYDTPYLLAENNTSTGIGRLVQDAMEIYISLKKICTSVVSRDKQWQAVHFSNFRSPAFLSILFSSEQ